MSGPEVFSQRCACQEELTCLASLLAAMHSMLSAEIPTAEVCAIILYLPFQLCKELALLGGHHAVLAGAC